MRLNRKLRIKWMAAAFAVAAVAAPGAQAQVALGESGASAAKVELASGGQAGQVVESSGSGAGGQVVESSGNSSGSQAVQSKDGFNWLSVSLAGCALAALGAAGAALNRRPARNTTRALL